MIKINKNNKSIQNQLELLLHNMSKIISDIECEVATCFNYLEKASSDEELTKQLTDQHSKLSEELDKYYNLSIRLKRILSELKEIK